MATIKEQILKTLGLRTMTSRQLGSALPKLTKHTLHVNLYLLKREGKVTHDTVSQAYTATTTSAGHAAKDVKANRILPSVREAQLLDFLTYASPRTLESIAHNMKCSKDAAKAALYRLASRNKVQRDGAGYWSLRFPEQAQAQAQAESVSEPQSSVEIVNLSSKENPAPSPAGLAAMERLGFALGHTPETIHQMAYNALVESIQRKLEPALKAGISLP